MTKVKRCGEEREQEDRHELTTQSNKSGNKGITAGEPDAGCHVLFLLRGP
jgi:hypothetical protein